MAIGRDTLCQSRQEVESGWLPKGFQSRPWGEGTELYKHTSFPQDLHQWLMFNEDHILVGAITVYPEGLSLDPYPRLRDTLSQLPPAREFYLNTETLLKDQDPDSVILYRTGEAKTTHQYFLRKRKKQEERLIMAVFILDPYEQLLDGSHQNFLSYVKSGKFGNSQSTHSASREPSAQRDKDFLGLQQFARGEISLFGSCGKKHPEIALDAYQKALQTGLPDKTYTAEAHHRMGLAFKSLGKFNEAKSSLEQALAFEPHSATMLNSYGTVLTELHELPQAISAYEQALALKPDYANARFNLAEACEGVNPKRAIQEYETYLILAEDQPQESSKIQIAKEKLQYLQRGH